MNLWQSLSGMLSIRITSADPGKMLDIMNASGIVLMDISAEDALTIKCRIRRCDWKCVQILCDKQGAALKVLEKKGIYWKKDQLLKRPVLLVYVTLFLLFVGFLPTRVLFFEVNGNITIPDRMILEAAERCGIRFGASRSAIRSEKMKNALLGELPELQWAGINTYGCRAVISVKEQEQDIVPKEFPSVTSIVAARDGMITSCTATRGNAVCTVGQSVKKNQLLISPYADCGLTIKVIPAQGEVFAQTSHTLQTVFPSMHTDVQQAGKSTKRYSLIFGKKRINLHNDSGISDATCDRMYSEYYLTLPGDFRLPVCLAVDTFISRTGSPVEISKSAVEQVLVSFSKDYVRHQMIAGTILADEHSLAKDDAVWVLDSSFVCSEMIGRMVEERNEVIHE